ncbi:MAG: acetolactate synthase, small subunit [Clostridiales bacterium]|jgi:acetolactate synthase-1/3 small subunit|nr:acetolactate synthase, small subunit [Clostridiales bacterium]
MKKRWISLFVENNVGVLAKISGMFSGKAYNLESLTVGETEDKTMSRITIGLMSNDEIFEQIKKQLNRCVDVIKVIDLTDLEVHLKELMFIKIMDCSLEDREEIFRIAKVYDLKVIDYNINNIVVESVNTDSRNNEIINLMKKFKNIEVVRGGSVAMERV